MGNGANRKLEALLQAFSGPVFLIEPDGTYEEVIASTDYGELLVEDPTALEGQRLHDVLPTETAHRFHSTIESVIDSGTASMIEYELEVPAGSRWFEAAITPLPPEGDQPDAVIWAAKDITERKQREGALTALHGTALDLLTSDSRDRICQLTIHAAEEILAFDQSLVALEDDGVLRVQVTSDQLPDDATTAMPIEEGIAGETYRTGQSYRIDDLTEVEGIDSPEPYRSILSVPAGGHGNFQAIAEEPNAFDETDQELAELLIAQTDAALSRLEHKRALERQNERLAEFTRFVSHDLRNPLNVADGHLELAMEEFDSDNLVAMREAHDRMNALIDDLLSLAREDEPTLEMETVHLPTLVENCWRTVHTGAATLRTETDRRIRAEEGSLRQLFENLMRNAVEHVGDDVTITVGGLADGFYVEDDGPGIPPEERERIFEAGYSTRADGTGYGLRIVEQAVRAHDWTVSVTDGSDGGARFEFTGVTFTEQ